MKWSVGSLDDDFTIRELIRSVSNGDESIDLVAAMEEYAEYGVKYLHDEIVENGQSLSAILTKVVDAAKHNG